MNDLEVAEDTDERAQAIASRIALTSRRGLMCGAFGLSAAAVLAACSSGESNDGQDDSAGDTDDGGGDDPGGDGEALAKVSDLPVGGGIAAGSLILVQPEEGTVKAFNRACPHKGAQVDAPDDSGTIVCPSHGSEFNAEDGAVTNGPAEQALEEVEVEVREDEVFKA